MKIVSVVGARPNFMKIAPLCRALQPYTGVIDHVLVHTGQHYDVRMSAAFFEALSIPEPDINLEIGSGSHAEQVGRTMIAFEKVVQEVRPDWVVVVGDVNATCACSITAKKEHVKLAHIEAGLRSFDLDMPEEINRMVTDRLADLLFTTDSIADANLRAEGVAEERICQVGNVMIDTLMAHRDRAEALDLNGVLAANRLEAQGTARAGGIELEQYAVLTMHRPSNVDSAEILAPIVAFLVDEVAVNTPIVWPIHPRAKKQLESFGLWERVRDCPGLHLLNPVGYHEMLKLNMHARIMLTDSGGLQEECCVLGTPCLTLRWNTERPVTLEDHHGVSILVGNDVEAIRSNYNRLRNQPRRPHAPPKWDGRAAERIARVFVERAAALR